MYSTFSCSVNSLHNYTCSGTSLHDSECTFKIATLELSPDNKSGDGQSVHPDTTFIVKEMDLVKDVLDKYFVKEDLIIFDSDYTVKGFPLDADLIVRDMGFEPGSSVATVCVMNAGALEQLARVRWRLSVVKATLKDKKRKYLQADVERGILEV